MSLGGAPTDSEEQERVTGRVRAEQQARHCAVNTGGPATAVVAAQGAGRHVMFMWIHWSYDAVPTGGQLTIADGATTYRVDVTEGGAGFLPFDGVRWAANAAVTVTLASGGAGVTGAVNVLGARSVTG